jgi:hypothetical protein
MTAEEKIIERFKKIAEEDRRLIRLHESAGFPTQYSSYSDLGLSLSAWWEYREWLNSVMYPEE